MMRTENEIADSIERLKATRALIEIAVRTLDEEIQGNHPDYIDIRQMLITGKYATGKFLEIERKNLENKAVNKS